MFFSFKNIERLGKLNELVSLQNQVGEARLEDKIRWKKFSWEF